MWCIRCGARDPGPGQTCQECGNEVGPPEARVGYFSQMMKLTGQLLTEQLTLEEYEKCIQWATEAIDDMSKSFDPIEQQMKQMGFNELAMSLLNRPMSSFREGIQTFHEGLKELRYYVYEQNQSHLHTGLTLLEKANNLFNYTADTANYMINDISKELTEEEIAQVEKQAQQKLQ